MSKRYKITLYYSARNITVTRYVDATWEDEAVEKLRLSDSEMPLIKSIEEV